jgi:hypothetical protein
MIQVIPVAVKIDPSVKVFNVVMEDGTGSWHASFGSVELVNAFLYGVKSAMVMAAGRLIPAVSIGH